MRSLKLLEIVLQIREEYQVNLEIIHKANFSEFLRNYFVYIQKAGPPKQTNRTPCVHFKRATSYKINVKNVTHIAKIQKGSYSEHSCSSCAFFFLVSRQHSIKYCFSNVKSKIFKIYYTHIRISLNLSVVRKMDKPHASFQETRQRQQGFPLSSRIPTCFGALQRSFGRGRYLLHFNRVRRKPWRQNQIYQIPGQD